VANYVGHRRSRRARKVNANLDNKHLAKTLRKVMQHSQKVHTHCPEPTQYSFIGRGHGEEQSCFVTQVQTLETSVAVVEKPRAAKQAPRLSLALTP
jgi:hypothetical protein